MTSRKRVDESISAAPWQVTQCTCGTVTLTLGAIRVEFTAQEFARLGRLVAEATTRFAVSAGETAVADRLPLTH